MLSVYRKTFEKLLQFCIHPFHDQVKREITIIGDPGAVSWVGTKKSWEQWRPTRVYKSISVKLLTLDSLDFARCFLVTCHRIAPQWVSEDGKSLGPQLVTFLASSPINSVVSQSAAPSGSLELCKVLCVVMYCKKNDRKQEKKKSFPRA